MDTPLIVAIISAAAAIVVPVISFYLTKSKERQADWQRYKFDLYTELVQSLSGIVGTDSSLEGNRRFASACNTLHLIGSKPRAGRLAPLVEDDRKKIIRQAAGFGILTC